MLPIKLKYSKYHKVIFILSVFVLLFIGSITFNHLKKTNQSSQLVMHTYEVGMKLEELLSHVKDSEINIRSFSILKDSTYLLLFNSSELQIDTLFSKIKILTSDSKIQQDNLQDIIEIVKKRNDNIANYLTSTSLEVGFNDDYFRYRFNENNNLLVKIRKNINLMINVEKDNLQFRNENYSDYKYLTPILTLGILLVSLLLLILTYIKINMDIETLRKSNTKLSKAQFLSKQAEILSKFGTWDWNLVNNEVSYSDNLYRILGFERQNFEPGKTFNDYVHPEDRAKLEQKTESIRNGQEINNFYFRIIDAHGQTKHLRASGKIFENQLTGRTILGLTADVTAEHVQILKINERNMELEQHVKELDEFNHLVSHDLQEPLRKIETFISLLDNKELNNLSDFGKGYVIKISKASSRMRKLINDMLEYSRTSRADKNYEKIDLTSSLYDSLMELSHTIEVKKAIINQVSLPTIDAIEFQMQQLFTNLISNSLKYTKENVAPVIDITYRKVIALEESLLKLSTADKYHKITIADGGIGFEQEYSEEIFKLFNRLHGKTEYEGTGVGLAICKKIVENHRGYIFAKSSPNLGSEFIIYIPYEYSEDIYQ